MTTWVRLWHDMPTDPKWRVIARKSGQPLPCVIAVFNLLMINASANAAARGELSGWDDEDAGAALDMDSQAVNAITEAMQGKVLDGLRLTGWEKRQPKREDGTAAARKSAWKERRNAMERNGTHRDAPETETETETDKNTSSLRSDVARVKKPDLDAELLAAGIDRQHLDDWKRVRKAKRAGEITQTVLDGLRREAGLAGVSVGEAVRIAVERGWQGFKAEWLTRSGAGPPSGRPRFGDFAATQFGDM